jgi:MoxR-like ATPase
MPPKEDLKEILARTTDAHMPSAEKVISQQEAGDLRAFVRELLTADNIKDYVVRLILATHPDNERAPELVQKYVRYGSSPRGGQALTVAGKVYAAMDGRLQVGFEDVRRAVYPALRHRILLNFEGEAEGIGADDIITAVIESVPQMEGVAS